MCRFFPPPVQVYPLIDRPAVPHLSCAHEICCAQCLRCRTGTAQLSFLLPTLIFNMTHDKTDRFV
jgi:hypothetical protein